MSSLLPSPVPAHQLGKAVQPIQGHYVERFRPPEQRPPFPVFLLGLLLGVLLVVGSVLWFVQSSASVTILVTASRQIIGQHISLVAATGTAPPGQLQARILSASGESAAASVPATGVERLPELVAHGSITFYNLLLSVQTVSPHTVLTASNGVQVETLAQAVVPPASGSPLVMGQNTVPAQATQPGAVGNIAAGAVFTSCCNATGTITAKNQQAFVGGQDAASQVFIQQSDVAQVAAPLVQQAQVQARTALSAKLESDDLAAPASCTTLTITTPPTGSPAATFSVRVTVTCREAVVSRSQAEHLAVVQFVSATAPRLGSSYELEDRPVPKLAQIFPRDAGTFTVTVPVRGVWRGVLDRAALHALLPELAGKSWTVAQVLLTKQPGVGQVTVVGNPVQTLPHNPNQIALQFN